MSNYVGNLPLPVPVPDDEASVGDPALDVLASFFETVLRSDLAAAWDARNDEPVIRTVSKHDPEEVDFSSADLPLLSCWRGDDSSPSRGMDTIAEIDATFMLLWIPPPAPQGKSRTWHSFFSAFNHSVAHAVKRERHQSWIYGPDSVSLNPMVVAESGAYGSNVLTAAGFSTWHLQSVVRVPVDIPINGAGTHSFAGYLATINATEWTVTDSTAYGVYPTVIHGDLTTQDKTIIRGSFRDPSS